MRCIGDVVAGMVERDGLPYMIRDFQTGAILRWDEDAKAYVDPVTATCTWAFFVRDRMGTRFMPATDLEPVYSPPSYDVEVVS